MNHSDKTIKVIALQMNVVEMFCFVALSHKMYQVLYLDASVVMCVLNLVVVEHVKIIYSLIVINFNGRN